MKHDFKIRQALAGVVQQIECWPANHRVTTLILSHGTCVGCRPDPLQGRLEAQLHTDVTIPLLLSQFPSKYKQNLFKNILKKIWIGSNMCDGSCRTVLKYFLFNAFSQHFFLGNGKEHTTKRQSKCSIDKKKKSCCTTWVY